MLWNHVGNLRVFESVRIFCSFKRSLLESLGWKENPSKKLKLEQLNWSVLRHTECVPVLSLVQGAFLHLWFDSPRDIKHKATPQRFVPKFRFGRLKIIYIYITLPRVQMVHLRYTCVKLARSNDVPCAFKPWLHSSESLPGVLMISISHCNSVWVLVPPPGA